MPTFFVNTDDARISNAFLATLGAAPGSTYLAQIKAFGLVNSVNAMIAATGKTTAADLATTITGNLGLTGAAATAGQAYLTSVTLAGASSSWAANLISTLDLFTTLQNDATYGTAASAYVARINSAVAYSAVAANNSTDLNTLAAAVGSAGSTGAGSTVTFTTNIDTFLGTAGNDVFIGDSTTGQVSSGDSVNGGAGTDTLKLYATTNKPGSITNVENIYLNAPAGDFDVKVITGVSQLEVDSEALAAARAYTIGAGQTLKLTNITTNTANDVDVTQAASLTSTSLIFSKVGDFDGATNNDVDINGTGVTAVSMEVTGSANSFVELVNTGSAVTSLTITGDKILRLDASNVSTITSITASGNTAGVNITLATTDKNHTITLTSANDTLDIDAIANLTSFDTIDMGAGTDNVTTSAQSLSTADIADINSELGASAEILGFDTADDLTLDLQLIGGDWEAFRLSTAGTGSAGTAATAATGFTGTTGETLITITGTESDVIQVTADKTGGAGGNISSALSGSIGGIGGDAFSFTPDVDGGSDKIYITLGGGVDIVGGAGGGGVISASVSGLVGGAGGDAISAASFEAIYITSNYAANSTTGNTIVGGAGGSGSATAGAAGDAIVINSNGTVYLDGAANITISNISGTNANVDASNFTGKLTLTNANSSNNTIKGGSNADTIRGGGGYDTLTGNGGADTFRFALGANASTNSDAPAASGTAGEGTIEAAFTTITDYQLGSDKISVVNSALASITASFSADTSATAGNAAMSGGIASFNAADDTLTEKVIAVAASMGTFSAGTYAAFSHGGDTYLFVSDATLGGSDGDLLIKLTGVSVSSTSVNGDGYIVLS